MEYSKSSLDIAIRYNRKHSHVLRSIESLLKEKPEGFLGKGIKLSYYKDTSGKKINAIYYQKKILNF